MFGVWESWGRIWFATEVSCCFLGLALHCLCCVLYFDHSSRLLCCYPSLHLVLFLPILLLLALHLHCLLCHL
jgi:hypothetical protein